MKSGKLRINNSNISWAVITVLVALLFARDIFGTAINKFVFVGLASFAMFLVDKYEICEQIAFMIPLFAGLPGNYIACGALLLLIVKSKGNFVLDRVGFWCSAAILLVELLAEMFSGIRGYSFSVVEYVKFAGAFLLTFIVVFDADNQCNYWKIARNFLFGLAFAVVIIVGEMLNHYSLVNILTMGIRIGDISEITGELVDEMTLSYNANALGMFCSASIMVCLLAITKFGKKWLIPLAFVFALTGIMTQSRAFVIILLLGIVMFIITGNGRLSTISKRLLLLTICVSLGSLLVMKYIPSYFESLLGRFQEADISNGRVDITSQYWERFVGNTNAEEILFGVGLQNYRQKYGMAMAAHLGFEEVLITWGIIGCIVVMIMLFRMVKKLNYKRLCDYDMLIPFCVYLIGLQSGQFFSNTTAFMSLLIWISFAKITEKKSNVVEESATFGK